MTTQAKERAASLRGLLAAGLMLPEMLLELYRFIDETADATFGWQGRNVGSIDGVLFENLVADWHAELRGLLERGERFEKALDLASLGEHLASIAATGLVSPAASRDLVMAVKTLDSAFYDVHPGESPGPRPSRYLETLRTQVRKGQSLFSVADFHAYPKPRRLIAEAVKRGQSNLHELLEFVTVVRFSPSLAIEYWVELSDGIHRDGFTSVGVVPTVNNHAELEWHIRPDAQYTISENSSSLGTVNARVKRAVTSLARKGADLIMLPELVCAPSTLDVVQTSLRERAEADLPNPKLTLAGTWFHLDAGGVLRNRATVLDEDGEIAWTQDKLHAYTFTAQEQGAAGHPMGTASLEDRTEAIALTPRKLVVVDKSVFHRVIVLTCEDFVQDEPHRDPVCAFNATLILVPIMSGPRPNKSAGWITDAAMSYVRHPAATSIVVNSGTLLPDRSASWQFQQIMSSPRIMYKSQVVTRDSGSPSSFLVRLPRRV